ncbi:MAG: ABC transporter ATP-binding protein [Nitrospiria bacterium]
MAAAIETDKLSKTFRSGFLLKAVPALFDLSLKVDPGTIFGFLGPNGAGKTTTLKLLVGLIRPTSGDGAIFGKSIRDVSVRARLGFLPERPYFYEYLTGLEFLHFCGELFGQNKTDRAKKIDALLDLVQLKGAEGTPLRKYSKGMLQRIGLAQALINDPDLVILDEPMSGLDPIGRKQVRDIILHLKEMGKTVFFSTHILSDAEVICDEVAILVKGVLKNQGKLETLLDPKTQSIDVCLRAASEKQLQGLKAVATAVSFYDQCGLISVPDEAHLSRLITWVQQEKAQIISITPRKESLEDIFMEKIQGGLS